MNAEGREGSQPRALVHGLGRFGGGTAAVRFLQRRGYAVRIADRATSDELESELHALRDIRDVELQLGREDPGLLDDVDLLVVNPAIPGQHPYCGRWRHRASTF